MLRHASIFDSILLGLTQSWLKNLRRTGMKMNMEIYGQFLLSSQINYTCTYLADHLDSLNHDNVQYFLAPATIRPRNVWKAIRHTFVSSSEGYLLFDDTVLSKVHSRNIELVCSQWSGNAHGVIKGIGVVNCVYFNPLTAQFWLLDYRIFAPDTDGKTKIDHVMDMLASVKHRGISYGCVLMDSWYAATAIMKYVIGEQKLFYCPLKTNRKVDDSAGQSPYVQLKELQWSDSEQREGKLTYLPLQNQYNFNGVSTHSNIVSRNIV